MYGLKHHIVEISGDVTAAGQSNKQTTREGYSAFDLGEVESCNSIPIGQMGCLQDLDKMLIVTPMKRTHCHFHPPHPKTSV